MIIDSISVHKDRMALFEPRRNRHHRATSFGGQLINHERPVRFTDEMMKELQSKIPPFTPQSTKQYYAQWVKTIAYEPGDYLVPAGTRWPYRAEDWHRVVQIQQVHHFVSFDVGGSPMPIELVTGIGTRFWTGVTGWRKEWIVPLEDHKIDLPVV